LKRRQVQKMGAEATLDEGVPVLDDTGFREQGKGSLGVAASIRGTLGNMGNCQVTVTCRETAL
jgi:SRSO17 transposase